MNAIAKIVVRQTFLKPKYVPQVTSVATKVIMSHSDGIFRMGKLKTKYLRKAPIITTKANGEVQIEGVSNKQYPQPAPWTKPEYYFRGNPGEDGSGDLGLYPEPDMKRPMLEFVGLKAYENASPEVKRVLSLEMGRRADVKKIVNEDFRYTKVLQN